jgi:pyruvate kinase
MARHAASFRPRYSPIYALCEFPGIADSLSLNYGVESFVQPFDHERPERTVESALKSLVKLGRLWPGNTTVVITSITAGDQIADVVEMRMV